MSLSNKEQKIKELLTDLNVDLDTQEIWNALDGKLPVAKKKRRPIWMFWALIPLLGFLSYIALDVMNEQATESVSSDEYIQDNVDVIQPLELADKTQLITSAELEKTQSTVKKESLNQSNITDNQTSIRKTNFIPSSHSQSETETETEKISAKENIQEATPADPTKINEASSTEFSDHIIALKKELSILQLTSLLPYLELQSRALPILDVSAVPLIKPLDQKWKTLLSFRVGANRNISTYKIGSNDILFDIAELDREKDVYGHNLEMYIDAYNKSGWVIGTGMAYSRTTTQYAHFGQTKSVTNQADLLQTTIRENNIQWHRLHRSADIRMKVSKEIFRCGPIVIAPEVGLGYNLWSAHSGYYFANESVGLTTFTNNEITPYKTTTLWNGQAGIHLLAKFKNWEIGLVPYIRYNPNSITLETNFYRLKNSQAGLQISVAYKPNWE